MIMLSGSLRQSAGCGRPFHATSSALGGTNPRHRRFPQNGRRPMAAHASHFSRLDPIEIAMIAASIGLVTLVAVIF
jgi:hypothetical protein